VSHRKHVCLDGIVPPGCCGSTSGGGSCGHGSLRVTGPQQLSLWLQLRLVVCIGAADQLLRRAERWQQPRLLLLRATRGYLPGRPSALLAVINGSVAAAVAHAVLPLAGCR
jgi:hypothetical protein